MTTKTNDKSITRELLELETGYWQAVKDHDVEAASRTMDDQVIVAMPTGVDSINAQSFKQMMKGMDYTMKSFKIKDDDVKVRQLTDDVALLGYQLNRDMTIEGQAMKLDSSEASVWVRRGNRWLCAMHAEAPFGDGFGRDRKGMK